MLRYFYLLSTLLLFLLVKNNLSAQKLLIVNGGIFGSSDYANVAIYDIANANYTVIDTIFVNSVQDVFIENDSFAYVAAQDSIIKYNLITGDRLAATAFNAPSTVRLKVWQNKLLVGNWYAPFGFSGTYTNNFRLFDKQTLTYLDSIPQVTKGATDFVIVNDTAYIAQNTNDASTNFEDAQGYLSVVDLQNNLFVRNDTLNTQGYDLGRMVLIDAQIATVNRVSNTISYYNTANPSQKSTVMADANADLQPVLAGGTIYKDTLDNYFFPFNDAIGSYNLVDNSIAQANIVQHGQTVPFSTAFAYTVDNINHFFYLSKIFYSNQSANYGVVYDYQGDSVATFPVGYSPEVIAIFGLQQPIAVQKVTNSLQVSIFPNPATDFINVQTPNSTLNGKQWFLYSSEGKILQSGLISDNFQLSINHLPQGIYWFQAANLPLKAIFKQ